MNVSIHAIITRALAAQLLTRHWCFATAESCTGGLLAGACTELPGASAWFERGWVTYSNAAKTELLGVDAALIAAHGAVSAAVAAAMAQGALQRARAQMALSVTGVAGPDGGSADKPVGTVWFGFAQAQQVHTECCLFAGDRHAIRHASVLHALQRACTLLETADFPP